MTEPGNSPHTVRIESLLQAVQGLAAALSSLGLQAEESDVQARMDELDHEVAEAGLSQMEEVEHYLAVSSASLRLLAAATSAAFAERGDSEHSCFRQIPPALMHLVSGERQRYWVCEHIPSHRLQVDLMLP